MARVSDFWGGVGEREIAERPACLVVYLHDHRSGGSVEDVCACVPADLQGHDGCT